MGLASDWWNEWIGRTGEMEEEVAVYLGSGTSGPSAWRQILSTWRQGGEWCSENGGFGGGGATRATPEWYIVVVAVGIPAVVEVSMVTDPGPGGGRFFQFWKQSNKCFGGGGISWFVRIYQSR